MPAVVSALMCHAPIVIPDVVGAKGEPCVQTTVAMRAAAARVVARRPDVLVLISPHAPRNAGAFSLLAGPRIAGDFGDFGTPNLGVDLPNARTAHAAITAAAAREGAAVVESTVHRLDHGTLVPLHFLAAAGWSGPTIVIALPRVPTTEACHALGRALATAAGSDGSRWAVVASGDCSHRLIPGAPSGYHPQAARFDEALCRAVRAGDNRGILVIDPQLRALAAEDVVDTTEIAAAATGFRTEGREVLSYEGPYGVGYLVAVLYDAAATDGARVLVDVARDALAAHLHHRERAAFATTAVDALPFAGAFVTWRENGELRGCVGRMELDVPISQAVASLAVSAASSDPRFEPIELDELPRLSAEVTLVSPSEPISSVRELDPQVWGVEVRCGARHGVLLPALEGVDDGDTQVQIALKKAGIRGDEPYQLRRFRARKVC